MRVHQKTLLLCILSIFVATIAQADFINLNDFFADPAVTVAADGSSALMEEDPFLSPILLSNDPGLGDPNVIIPGPVYLTFGYSFTEGASDNDEFGAYVFDADLGPFTSLGPELEFFTQNSSSGIVRFDLSGLTGRTLGMQFELTALPGDPGTESMVTLSNVHTEPIPEPGTLLLLGTGLAGFAGYGIRFRRKKK